VRVVFDTNVIVSALLFEQSEPGRAFYRILLHGEILVSQPVIEELNDVLKRDKFNRYVHKDEREQFLKALLSETTLVDPEEKIQECRDSKDDKFLELAACGNASYLVTGDSDLLSLHPFRGIEILSPTQFLDALSK
jgi:putative PIN family toxin of toxin-antitoxin system